MSQITNPLLWTVKMSDGETLRAAADKQGLTHDGVPVTPERVSVEQFERDMRRGGQQ